MSTNTKAIRQRVKVKLIRLELDGIGMKKQLAAELGINYQQFIMALTGSRQSPKSAEILQILEDYLDDLDVVSAA